MADEVVRVRGLRELSRTFRFMPADLRKEIRAELRALGEPTAADARARLGRYSARSAQTIRHRLKRDTEVVVEQTRRTTTGSRPDWGAFQMRVLLAARASKREEMVRRFENAIDRLADRHGF